MSKHEHNTVGECWFWWVGTWVGYGEAVPDYNETVARELFDYHGLLSGLGEMYDTITSGRLSKPNTGKQHIIAAVEERVSSAYDEGYDDGYEQARYECEE
jgi:hypothetical protein